MGKYHVSGNAWCKLCVSTNCKFNYLLSVVWFIYVIVLTRCQGPHQQDLPALI